MHANTVSTKMLATLQELMKDQNLSEFILVGGTALSLQIGHRMSADLDLFTAKAFDKPELTKYLIAQHHFRLPSISDMAIRGFIGNVKVDLVSYENGFLNPPLAMEGIRMAGLEDIAVMKLEAIANVQNRLKDYVDIAFLSEYFPLEKMLAGFNKKFGLDQIYAIRSLSTFSQIQLAEDIFLMNGKFEWKKITERIKEMIKNPSHIFNPMA